MNKGKSTEFSWLKAIRKGLPVSRKEFKHTGKQIAFMGGVTLVGQVLFALAQNNT